MYTLGGQVSHEGIQISLVGHPHKYDMGKADDEHTRCTASAINHVRRARKQPRIHASEESMVLAALELTTDSIQPDHLQRKRRVNAEAV